jgi:hypothetical protein
MSFNKQQTVHLLPVPFELSEIINSFLFEDIKTSKTKKFIKMKKRKIVEKFKNSYCSRNQPRDIYLYDNPDACEHWSVHLCEWFNYENYDEEVQFQAINCKKCGNYKLSSDDLIQQIVCRCPLP